MKKYWVALLLLGTIVSATSCRFGMGKRVKGNGNVSTDNRAVPAFSGVESNGSYDIFVSEGANSLKIEGDENLLSYIESTVENGILIIRTRKGFNLDTKRDLKLYISAPSYSKIVSNGSGDIVSQTKVTSTGKMELGVNGSADITVEVDAPEVSAEINGSGNVKLKGQTKTFKGHVVGSGDIRAMELMSEETSVNIMGSGNADVYASVKLNVDVAGSGDVKYKGGGQVNSHIAGSGEVKKLD